MYTILSSKMNETENTCLICCEEIFKKNCCIMECNHQFHTTCLIKYFATSNTFDCPFCKTSYNYQTDITNNCLIGLHDLGTFGLEGEVTELNILNFIRDNKIKNNQLTPELSKIVKNAEQLQTLAQISNHAFYEYFEDNSETSSKDFLKN